MRSSTLKIAFHTLDLDAYGLSDLAKHGDYVGRQLARWKTPGLK